ncbi:Coproporphyrinogen-III oxidase [Blastocladiella emersonii ATCC 22665]|nr:Coproporphyrinogen-III oxidase [Blastocladiella emersonii ATCC 22665]
MHATRTSLRRLAAATAARASPAARGFAAAARTASPGTKFATTTLAVAAAAAGLAWTSSTTSATECKPASPSPAEPSVDMCPHAIDFRHRGAGGWKDATITDASAPMSQRMAAFTRELQGEIVSSLEALERAAGNKSATPFLRDAWTRPDGHGGGQSCVLQDGRVFEKAGVMVTAMEGKLSEAGAAQMRAQGRKFNLPPGTERVPFFAAGISIVIHPHNPNAPTAHMNYRYFEVRHPHTGEAVAWWFGGGADLTPTVVDPVDARHFHAELKAACDRHLSEDGYPALKNWCDEYFYLPHRGETRGVGGIFFDDFDSASPHTRGLDRESIFAFVRDAGRAFVPAYAPLVAKSMAAPYTHADKEWQQVRRGRYVEFNLVLDRGTKFGLLTPGARIESILVSLPLSARWEYCHAPTPGSPAERTLDILRRPRDWLNVGVGIRVDADGNEVKEA